MTVRIRTLLLVLLCAFSLGPSAASLAAQVKVWEEPLAIPTYVIGSPDPNPMFYTGRTYQGARGAIYPYPLYDKLTGKRETRSYKAVYLENEYVKICVLPELGGRIFSAVDKTNGYPFFYTQHVVKPALIGMLGAWISGGVEWNVPHHHRASSFLPVQYRTEQGADGSATVWVGEMELRHRMRWTVGLTLRPGKSYLQATVKVLNRTAFAQSLLYFANVAVHTNDRYQVIFPPGTQFVTQHAKREFARWPVADSMYGGIDFKRGVDVSWWKNHPSPISMFAWNYRDDFLAGYDHGKQAGTLHVADHHVVPGKKFFTWGTGPGGQMWDRILSDEDGPYLELMVGAYSDNQPDYSWIQPFEVKSFEQVWYPFRDIGGVKNATREAAVNLEVKNGRAHIGFHVTTDYPDAVVSLQAGGRTLLQEKVSISPGKPFVREVLLTTGVSPASLRAALSVGGKELVAYAPSAPPNEAMPKPVQPPAAPARITTNEELYLTGLRAEQFHSPAVDPYPYYEEALRRDPDDARVNTALGELYLKRAMYADAEQRLETAIGRLSKNYTAPRDGEAHYYLGIARQALGKTDAAFDAFYQATWSDAWQAAAYHSLAEIACIRGQFSAALDFVARSLAVNGTNPRAINLKSAVLRHLARYDEAAAAAEGALAVDRLDLRARAELYLDAKAAGKPAERLLEALLKEIGANQNTALEVAVEYAGAGLWEDALETASLLAAAPLPAAVPMATDSPERTRLSPLVHYYIGYFAEKAGRKNRALDSYRSAAQQAPDYAFPFQLEAIEALRHAIAANPPDARAHYYLGNALYDIQPENALKEWEASRGMDPNFAPVYRNMAVAYSRNDGDTGKAIQALETAIRLNPDDPMYFFELDQQYEAAGAGLEKRLAMMDSHHATVAKRDDTLSREIALRVHAGQYDRAIELLAGRHFHTWEGGARFNLHDSWVDAHLLRGQARMKEKNVAGAMADYEAALQYPDNLEVAQPYRGDRAPEVLYWVGTAYEAAGRKEQAREAWKQSAAELLAREEARHVSADGGAVLLYYEARSLEKLGETARAAAVFNRLVDAGRQALRQTNAVDYFAKFGERQSGQMRQAQAHFIAGLGYEGLKQVPAAHAEFTEAVKLNAYHLAARQALAAMTMHNAQ